MLKLNDIGLSFANKKHVLDDVTLTLNQKEIVGLVAPNGTGKTTLLNVIMNNLKPDRGYVEVDGLRYESNQAIKAIYQKICAFPLESELFGELTGYELAFTGQPAKSGRSHSFSASRQDCQTNQYA